MINNMNETLQVIAKRYSCRSYDNKKVEKEKVEAIALAAIQSPSAMNRQPWKIMVITDKSLIDAMDQEAMSMLAAAEDKTGYERMMSRGGKLFYNASVMFLILKQANKDLDTGIVSQNIALAATSLGLGNVICGMAAMPFASKKGEEFKQKVGISEEWKFGIAVLVGYAKEEGIQHTVDTSKIDYIE